MPTDTPPRTPSETLEAARAMNVLEGLLCDCPGSGKRERAWVAASDALTRLTERNRALEALVEAAYREGWNDGVGDGHPLAMRYTASERWRESGAADDLRALTNKEAP